MLFKPELAVKIIRGEKTQTRRWTPYCPVRVGNEFWAQTTLFKSDTRFARLLAIQTWDWNPLMLTKAVAKAEGFDSASEFSKAYQAINAHKTYRTKSGKWREHWAIEFQVVNLYYHPNMPEAIKEALRAEAPPEFHFSEDADFPANAGAILIPQTRNR